MSLARRWLHDRLPAKIADRSEIHVLDIPSPPGTGHCVNRRLPSAVATNQAHGKYSSATLTRRFTDDAELIVRDKALKNDRAPLQLGTLHSLTRGSAGRAPNRGHGLDVFRPRGAEKLFDGEPRRRSTRQLANWSRRCTSHKERQSGGNRVRAKGGKHEPEP